MKEEYRNSAQWWSALLIDQFIKNGVTDFFPSPGMRNAPLLKAITSIKGASTFAGIDERAQSYRALAHIKVTKKPAVLICTSGTALANYLPAIIEARKTHLPLFVLSADRPGELLAVDANQTINQIEVLRNYTKSFWQASEPQENFPPRALAGKLAFLINDACKEPMGPMHINLPLREPLDESAEELSEKWIGEIKAIISREQPSLKFPPIGKNVDDNLVQELCNQLLKSEKPLLIFGPLDFLGNQDDKEISKFLTLLGGNFSCDITSGMKYSFGSEDGLIPTLDHPEVLAKLHEINPDIIVHFGHRLTSKFYYQFLNQKIEQNPLLPIIQVTDGHYHEDPGFSFTKRLNINPEHVINRLRTLLQEKDEVQTIRKRPFFNWSELIKKKRAIIESGPLSYPFITKRAVETLENTAYAFIGNSTFIRSFDSYASTKAPNNQWKTLANRGASGIEGHISMATGMMEASKAPSVAFIGDISLTHDMGSLMQLKKSYEITNSPLLVVIANNKGGGIFKLLPIGKNSTENSADSYIDLLTTPHSNEFTTIIKATGIDCIQVNTKEEYQLALDNWTKSPTLLFIEVLIEDENNAQLYDQLKTVKL